MSRFSLFYISVLLAVCCVASFVGVPVADAATLSLSPGNATVSVGQAFTVSVVVGSSDQAINATEGVVSFPADMLSVESVGKAGSIVSVWVQEPRFSNAEGSVQFEGVITNPGYTGASGRIVTISFRAKKTGIASLQFLSGAVLANDGDGTNVLQTTGRATYTITEAVREPKVVPQEPAKSTIGIDTPVITYYSKNPIVGDYLLVKGEVCPVGGTATMVLEHGSERKSQTVPCDASGHFLFVGDSKLEEGVYELSVFAKGKQGSESDSTARISILVRSGALCEIGYSAIDILKILTPLVWLLVGFLIAVLFYKREYMYRHIKSFFRVK